ncbi:hypothetical protein ACFFQW_05410 [Umezawaea endophytica]|uniref:Uncharacterized protein n=1 Tax=Umezawaea endophytica TaxID=1654476 RepID=A0A9X2ZY89_9PSEU|nr:hypothetical protein [Umezawaea endophytica]MCS7476189.1 hypothetical protein [Umezawaea endophytica]
MFAKIEHTDQIPSGAAVAHLMTEIGTGRQVVLSLHDDGGEFTVLDRWSGAAGDQEPAAVSLVHFDGPMSEARKAAGERGFEERIKPALREVPGYVGGIVLSGPGDSVVVVGMATSLEALEAGGVAVNSTDLLPDEDPALLTGPDRFVAHRVDRTVTRG